MKRGDSKAMQMYEAITSIPKLSTFGSLVGPENHVFCFLGLTLGGWGFALLVPGFIGDSF